MTQRITQVTTKLFGLTIISRILGLIRDLLIAWLVGAGALGDILACALRLPHLARRLLQEGLLSLTLVTTLLKLKSSSHLTYIPNDYEEIFFNKLKQSLFVIVSLLLIVAYGGAKTIACVLAPNFTLEQITALTQLIQTSLPYLLFVIMSALWMARLHAHQILLLPATLPILLNLIILLSLAMAKIFNLSYPHTIIWAISLAGLGQWLMQKLAFDSILKFKNLKAAIKNFIDYKQIYAAKKLDATKALRQTGMSNVGPHLAMMPLGLFVSSTQHILLIIAMVFISNLGEGYVAAQFYAERLLELPLGLIGVSLGLASLPILTQLATQGKWPSLARQLSQALHFAWLLTCPASIGLFIVSQPLVEILFGHGAFDYESSLRTANILKAYIPVIPAAIFQRLLLSACLALDGLKFVATTTCLVLALALLLANLGLYPPYIVALALGLQTLIFFFWLKLTLKSRTTKLHFAVNTLGKSSLCAILACSSSYLLLATPFGRINQTISLGVAIILAIICWGILLKYVSPNDWRRIKKIIRHKT